MRKAISAVVVACVAMGSFAAAPAMADNIVIKVKPRYPVVKRVVITRQPCYMRTVKTVTNRKTVIVKKRVCP